MTSSQSGNTYERSSESTTEGAGYPGAVARADLRWVEMDLTAIDLPDASFDAIYASHVLEHIPHDRLAMRELH